MRRPSSNSSPPDASRDPALWGEAVEEEAESCVRSSLNVIKEYADLAAHVIYGCRVVADDEAADKMAERLDQKMTAPAVVAGRSHGHHRPRDARGLSAASTRAT